MVAASTTSPRAAAIVRSIQGVLAALDDFRAKQPAAAAEIYALIAAHMRSAAPMAFAALPAGHVVEAAPEGVVTGQLDDGASYELRVVNDTLSLAVWDSDLDHSIVTMTEGQAGAFGRDYQRVLARLRELAKAGDRG